ncbi:kinase-like protein [Xylariaceae sp. FL0594]|nr:kinase-like protein [Xylariaceae sp. FL0594]
MEADPGLIACLVPLTKGAKAMVYKWLKPYSESVSESDHEPDDESDAESVQNCDAPAELSLRFSNGPRTNQGFIFGTSKNCDFTFTCNNKKSLSASHFSVTFDDEYRLIVKDLGSKKGLEVTYSSENQRVTRDSRRVIQENGRRSRFSWIIGHSGPQFTKQSIVINVRQDLRFRVNVSLNLFALWEYKDKVTLFRQGSQKAEDLFEELNFLSNPATEEPSEAESRKDTGPIFIRNFVGGGTFGVVFQVWDKHIVKLEASDFTNPIHPVLRFEYVPGGSLDKYEDLSMTECFEVLCQCLSALEYVHGLNPPIIHRDINPENILVQHRDRTIYVKFADFGISKESADPQTDCGTALYRAPEIARKFEEQRYGLPYTRAVDVWSLGVSVMERFYGLPDLNLCRMYGGGTKWCETVVEKLKAVKARKPDDLNQFLLKAMLVMDETKRWSAHDCLEEARELASRVKKRERTPTRANPRPDQRTVTPPPLGLSPEGPPTMIQKPVGATTPPPENTEVPDNTEVLDNRKRPGSTPSRGRAAKRQALNTDLPRIALEESKKPTLLTK